jgi:NADH dehydrogenase
MAAAAPVLVLGGSGFVGRHVVGALARQAKRVVVPTRRREISRHLILLPTVDVVEADVHDPSALAGLVAGSSAVVNAVGILNESGRDTFERAHVALARSLVAACRAAGVRRLVQVSALNADPDGPSLYQRSKGAAEAAIAASGLDWTILQPSVIFGPEDRFLNLFAKLLRAAPLVPLAGAGTRFQPVHVGDVAHCVVGALDLPATIGRKYPLCGPDVYTLAELVRFVGKVTGNERPVLALPPALGRMQARLLELAPGKPMTRDNLRSMEVDSVCECGFPPEFGISPASLALVAPEYLAPGAARSRYDAFRSQTGR